MPGCRPWVGAIQTFGDLIHWHSHIHAVVAEGVLTTGGHFVPIPEVWKHRAVDIWRDKVFALLLEGNKITEEIATFSGGFPASMRYSIRSTSWPR